jgi:Family of unknown function (DUF6370)
MTMLRTVCILAVALCLIVCPRTYAAEEKTLKGTVCCAKCELKQAEKCHTVVKVKEDGKDVIYWFDMTSTKYKEIHKEICTEAKEGSVTGEVSEKDGKKWIKASKVEFK